MSKVIDLTTIPALVTITNVSSDSTIREIDITENTDIKTDIGSTDPGAKNESALIKKSVIKAISTEIQKFGNNLYVVSETSDTLKLLAKTSNELMYCLNLKDKFKDLISVTVSEEPQPTPDPELVSISVTTQPTKTTYTVGETFDSTGMVVTALYDDESSKAVTDYTFSPSGELTIEDTKVTITYQEKTATVDITVQAQPEPPTP